MEEIAKQIIDCFKRNNKVMACGNGGSAAQSQHFCAELMGKFEVTRKPLPAIALTTDTSFLTAWSNDYDFTSVFSRQVEALGVKGDILIGFSTSGKSKNVLEAYRVAKKKGIEVIDFPRWGDNTAETQEFQLKLMHNIVRIVERAFL